ncbi:hypothetical protein [Dongia sp.]|uniref:hypothetical protein n=1 Tax=Dongia sp. TaxID=1977262 RepID=UPI0035B1D17B
MRHSLLPLAAALILGACTSTALLAKPDVTARIDQPPMVMSGCMNEALATEFPGTYPDLQQFGPKSEISLYAPRGGLIAFITVEPHPNGKSLVKFYNGDLYWPEHQVSGVFPDMARDNWHRVERALQACAPLSANVPANTSPTM